MKIATFNINNVRRRLPNLLEWLRRATPHVVCLQELKTTDAEFPADVIRRAGYEAVWKGQKSWNGVAILARGTTPIVTRTELPGDPADAQSRYVEAAVSGVLVVSFYAPNGNPQPGPKFDYKLAWMKRFSGHASTLYKAGIPVVLAGDTNVVPTERDIYPTKSYYDDALLQPASRKAYERLLAQGWIDAVRTLHPDVPMYTFWDYMRKRWERDAGLRLDQILLSSELAGRLVATGVDREVRGEDNASDHAPAWAELRDPAKSRAAAAREAPRISRPTARSEAAAVPSRPSPKKVPLLVIDGDSLAHRAYHALPRRSFARAAGRPAPFLGFANFLLRFYQAERPRAVLVGWDTLDEPTYRNRQFPAYQSGREFDDALVEQLDALPELVAACGFANAKAPGYEADDFLARGGGPRGEARRDGAGSERRPRHIPARLERTTILFPVRAGGSRASPQRRFARATASIRTKCRTSSPCAATPPTSCRALAMSARRVRPTYCAATARLRRFSRQAALRRRRRNCGSTARLPRWTERRRCRACPTRRRAGTALPRSREPWVSTSWRTALEH
jgi:exodeoxyribonuclease-3